MARKILIGMTLMFVACSSTEHSTEYDTEQLLAASRETSVEFMRNLKATLVSAIQEDGPVAAITICNSDAPAIAHEISQRKGWSIARTSLKLRNPANTPDNWERSVLNDFETRKRQGESPENLEHHEIVEMDGKMVFRYMKAIPTDGGCLVCHGDAVEGALAEEIRRLYPQDQAIGFRVGDLRGAFTIAQPL